MYEGTSFLRKIKESILAPFKFSVKVKASKKGISSTVGKRSELMTSLHRGRPWGWKIPKEKPLDIHLPATIRIAAKNQRYRKTSTNSALTIKKEDVRDKIRLFKAPMTIIFVLDLSGSMILSLDSAKEALLRLHRDAYRYRDKVGLVALKDTRGIIVQHPITNVGVVSNRLMSLKISSHTPLADGMLKAFDTLKQAKRRDRSTIPVIIIITDGNANVPLHKSLETGNIRKFEEKDIILRNYEDLAVKDVIAVSKLIKKEKIHCIAVNTNHYYGRGSYGSAVTKVICSTTGGSHHQIERYEDGKESVEEIFEKIHDDQRKIVRGETIAPPNLW